MKKATALLFLFSLLLYLHSITHSLSVLADAILSLTDALIIFALFTTIEFMADRHHTLVKVLNGSIIPLTLLLLLSQLSLFILLPLQNKFVAPELVLTAEIFYIMLLFYLYIDFRSEAVTTNTKVLTLLASDIERNIASSMGVILAALLSLGGMGVADKLIALVISTYTTFHILKLLKGQLGIIKNSQEVKAVVERVASQVGAQLEVVKATGVGPFLVVDVVVKTTQPQEFKWKIEEVIKRGIEAVLPAIASVRVR